MKKSITHFHGVRVNLGNYPGCPEGVNPLVGRSWMRRLDPLIKDVRDVLEQAGVRPTNYAVTRVINEQHHQDGFRYVSTETVRHVTKRLMAVEEAVDA